MVLFFNLLCMQLIDRFRVSFFSIHSAVLSTGIINIIRYCFFKLNILFGHFGRFSCSVCGGCGRRSAQQKFEFWTMKISVLLVFFQYTQCTGCGHPVCILKMQKKKKNHHITIMARNSHCVPDRLLQHTYIHSNHMCDVCTWSSNMLCWTISSAIVY